MIQYPTSLPTPHGDFLTSSINIMQRDTRIVGIAAGGSFLTDSMDEFSDLDLVIAVEPDEYESVMGDAHRIAGSLGPLLAAFTGEHVGEPRLLICLYDGTPPLHVDLKFVALPDAAIRIEDPVILWERSGHLTKVLEGGTPAYPAPDPQWIEDRFWVWLHYAAAKVGRGEIFEAVEALSFFRTTVLGPLALLRCGSRPAGVRKLEFLAPEYARDLQATVAAYSAADCVRSLKACVQLYRSLRAASGTAKLHHAAEEAAVQYLSDTERRLTSDSRLPPGTSPEASGFRRSDTHA